MRIFFLLFSLCLLGCQHQPHAYAPIASRGGQLDGFDGITFFMPYQKAYQQLVARSIPVSRAISGMPALTYDTTLDTHPVRVTFHFNTNERMEKIELMALEGVRVPDEPACDALYQRIAQSYRRLYGAPDTVARNLRKYEPQCRAQVRYSFANSSFIDLHVQYRQGASPACLVQAFYNPNWATLCLVTNQRFCDVPGNYMSLDQ